MVNMKNHTKLLQDATSPSNKKSKVKLHANQIGKSIITVKSLFVSFFILMYTDSGMH